VVRRAVIRHDGGWTDSKGDPEAGINFYNSSHSSAQNVIVLDCDLDYRSWQGSIYSVYNSASPNATESNSYYGNIALNDPNGLGFRLDGNGRLSDFIVQDLVAWDTLGVAMCSGSCRVRNITMNRMTIGQKTQGSDRYGIVEYGSGFSGNITNTIITGVEHELNLPATYINSYNNQNQSDVLGVVTYSPFTNGLLYPTRIEEGSALKTAGSTGGQIGAQIVNRIGSPGTLYGETGWNTETGTLLWPFPDESRIKKEMCTDPGVTRGFCSSTSLTGYINTYLGNPDPYDELEVLPAPTGLSVVN